MSNEQVGKVYNFRVVTPWWYVPLGTCVLWIAVALCYLPGAPKKRIAAIDACIQKRLARWAYGA